MSDRKRTSKRVNVTLTLATDVEPGIVMAGLIAKLGLGAELLVGTMVHDFDVADEDGPMVQLVIDASDGNGAPVTAFIDRASSAHAFAEEFGRVVVELPVDIDCRPGGGGR